MNRILALPSIALLVTLSFGARAADDATSALRIGTTPVAEQAGDSLRPLVDEGALIQVFQSAIAASGRADLQATITSARLEEVDGVAYAVARGTTVAAGCFTSWIRLEPGTGIAVEAAIKFIRIVTCVGTTCPQTGCFALRDADGEIQSCHCLPAGECERVVIIIPIPI